MAIMTRHTQMKRTRNTEALHLKNLNFGERLRKLRENADMTQAETAEKINCTARSLSNYERNIREPDFDTLIRLCDLFDVTADYLLGRTDHAHHYQNIPLDDQIAKMIQTVLSLPPRYQSDIIHYTKLNKLDFEILKKDKNDR